MLAECNLQKKMDEFCNVNEITVKPDFLNALEPLYIIKHDGYWGRKYKTEPSSQRKWQPDICYVQLQALHFELKLRRNHHLFDFEKSTAFKPHSAGKKRSISHLVLSSVLANYQLQKEKLTRWSPYKACKKFPFSLKSTELASLSMTTIEINRYMLSTSTEKIYFIFTL